MKQFEMFGRSLTKQEQKMIKGGEEPHTQFCEAGTTSYCCDVPLMNGTTAQETVCGGNVQQARGAAMAKHPNDATGYTTCEPA